MIDTPRVIQTRSRPAAVIRFTVPRAEMPNVMGPGVQELMAAISAQGKDPAGPLFAHHLRLDPDTFDFELGVPIPEPITAAGRVGPGELPGGKVARTVYHGPYEGLPGAWGEFDAWIEAEGHATGPDIWECYVAGPQSDPDPANWRTELNRPLVAQG